MRNIYWILICFLAMNASAQEWYKLKLDSMEVIFPGICKETKKELNTTIGMLKTVNYAFTPTEKDNNFFYSLNIVEYPSEVSVELNAEIIDSVLLTSIDQLTTVLKSKSVYNTSININSHPAYLFRLMDDVSGQVTKGYITFAFNRLYTIMVFTMKEKSLNDEMDKFLNSFKFTH